MCERFCVGNVAQMARETGVGYQRLCRLCRDVAAVPADVVEALRRTYAVSPSWLLKGGGDMIQDDLADLRATVVTNHAEVGEVVSARLPMYGEIVAGDPQLADPRHETCEVLGDLAGPGRYILRVSGDSMYPTLQDGDLILVDNASAQHTEWSALNGRIVAVLVNGRNTLKRLYVLTRAGKTMIELKGDNPAHPPIWITDFDEVTIQGVVLQLVGRDL